MRFDLTKETECIGAWLPEVDMQGWSVDQDIVRRIYVYGEVGNGAMVPWLCVELTNGRRVRGSAEHYEIHTKEASDLAATVPGRLRGTSQSPPQSPDHDACKPSDDPGDS